MVTTVITTIVVRLIGDVLAYFVRRVLDRLAAAPEDPAPETAAPAREPAAPTPAARGG